MTFGYYEPEFLENDITWSKIIVHSQPGIRLDNLLINGKDYGLCEVKKKEAHGCYITFDSGSTYNSIP